MQPHSTCRLSRKVNRSKTIGYYTSVTLLPSQIFGTGTVCNILL